MIREYLSIDKYVANTFGIRCIILDIFNKQICMVVNCFNLGG